ncbi:DUF4238 domain-containing protein [Sphingopyxis sp. FD7]|jgi:hypothetical protein|uniref:DUF4238 domain-containing protein n=1 Tax=Sphingopyxis sp. FD7 TaxID=1914525 RepID=UPI000DC61FD1|nr:DUF4238 domain-containing protein [Sphingopyxis sp. FD7]BBB12897.1 hypothetical protein SPYCA_2155 [Sphingopyxis sp. FD7]
MTEPKRHHWWPEVQSSQWAGVDGNLTAVRSDGSTFRAPPSKVGVEGELYTRVDPTGTKDRDIERWFSREIETPFSRALTNILPLPDIKRRAYPDRGDPAKRREMQELGFLISDYEERLPVDETDRIAIANYLAAAVVRSPAYLSKLTEWHKSNNSHLGALPVDPDTHRAFALENMLFLYDVYREAIANGAITLMVADCDRELLFSDGGVVAREPWSKRPIPFELYAPLTPKLALNVIPFPPIRGDGLLIFRLNSQGVSRFNRIMVGIARRFVFARSTPPLTFIKKNFGIPAPAPFASRWIDGKLETKYDRSRDRPS